jgi:hypothetical protein
MLRMLITRFDSAEGRLRKRELQYSTLELTN